MLAGLGLLIEPFFGMLMLPDTLLHSWSGFSGKSSSSSIRLQLGTQTDAGVVGAGGVVAVGVAVSFCYSQCKNEIVNNNDAFYLQYRCGDASGNQDLAADSSERNSLLLVRSVARREIYCGTIKSSC